MSLFLSGGKPSRLLFCTLKLSPDRPGGPLLLLITDLINDVPVACLDSQSFKFRTSSGGVMVFIIQRFSLSLDLKLANKRLLEHLWCIYKGQSLKKKHSKILRFSAELT